MIVGDDAVVSLDVEIWDLHGNQLDKSIAPMSYLHGGYDNIFAPVERALEGKKPGDQVEVHLEPEDAYGDYDAMLVRVEPRDSFPLEVEVGMQFEGLPGEPAADESDRERIFTITDIADDTVVVDGNHPFAGFAIKFRCTVQAIRAASDDEIAQGHPSDPSGGLIRVLH